MKKRVKLIKQINTFLTTWLNKHGFDCRAVMDTDFSYENNTVYYSLVVIDKHLVLFEDLCKQWFPEIVSCDIFILTFFHEVGHFMTEKFFTEQDEKDYSHFIDELLDKKRLTNKDYIAYYTHPMEKAATVWACEYIISNKEEIQDFYLSFQKLLNQFIQLNNIEN